jgi:glycosidase
MATLDRKQAATFEFHISRRSRERYQFDDWLFAVTGNVIFADIHAARVLADKMNARRDLIRFPEQAVRAGHLNSMGLIDEILHLIFAEYRRQINPAVMAYALSWLDERFAPEVIDLALRRFVEEFPPVAVHRGQLTIEQYLAGTTGNQSHRAVTLEEMVLLWLANLNPAFLPFRELFDDTELTATTTYVRMMASLHDFFDTQPRFGPDNQNLIDMLRAPALASPDSLEGQLEFIRQKWAYLLGDFLNKLLINLDVLREEGKTYFAWGGGPVQTFVPDYSQFDAEVERFSQDLDWMPRLVLIAKNTYVWLDQLSKEYQRNIYRLDQVPDEALAQLARRGFTGLWLIGVWERSPASRRIKQMMGNPEAVASAYSLQDYRIADDLGGDAAFQLLKARAWRHGIRMASDMVPNHMGIDSRWVIQHPDWFISLGYSPFPSYSFNGPDLSGDERVGIFLEDHYYDRSDAAVVFKRVDRWSGDERYVYHGNDGTRMPWNDTAQLNYLRPDVREAVIQTILHVARQFPIIRFDAAMTLAKRHYQRLWFPEPGSGGDIPSRAGQGMTRAQLDALMPIEFWREVVDRAAVEAPDTLLLAEAFWLMEGYFVRTLGMHRVYNSAFMNMLRDEDNAKYRSVMKNTLEFDPEILKRYVNFMSNPDEKTAIDQFGKDDKYFGICTMLATLPGLPMFGHGQIEGYAEQYGMEFRRAYWDETPDHWLVERHEREIFPLLHRRQLFAGVDGFRLYDFYTADGTVNEDVFAYSNRHGGEKALVVYHNRFADAQGWIRTSAGFGVKGSGDERTIVQTTLGEGLDLHDEAGRYCILRDLTTGLEYLRTSGDLVNNGLYVELGAYKYHVFVDIREVADNHRGDYARLASQLNGRGVPSVEEALREMTLAPILRPYRALVNAETVRNLATQSKKSPSELPTYVATFRASLVELLAAVRASVGGTASVEAIADDVLADLQAGLPLVDASPIAHPTPNGHPASVAPVVSTDQLGAVGTLAAWLITASLGSTAGAPDPTLGRALIDEYRLDRNIAATLADLGVADAERADLVVLVKILTSHRGWWKALNRPKQSAARALELLLADADVRQLLRINRFDGILWYNKEAFDRLLDWLEIAANLDARRDADAATKAQTEAATDVIARLRQAAAPSKYQVTRLLALVGESQGRNDLELETGETSRKKRKVPAGEASRD